jgi:DHA2 family multidrug resistance protein
MITLQAVIIAYIDDFKLLMILSILAMPLVLLLRKPATAAAVDHSAVME